MRERGVEWRGGREGREDKSEGREGGEESREEGGKGEGRREGKEERGVEWKEGGKERGRREGKGGGVSSAAALLLQENPQCPEFDSTHTKMESSILPTPLVPLPTHCLTFDGQQLDLLDVR